MGYLKGKDRREGEGREWKLRKGRGREASHLFSSTQDVANNSWTGSFLWSGGKNVRTKEERKKVIQEDRKRRWEEDARKAGRK
jgi:hypothetical protein